jgi:hypothetical protein
MSHFREETQANLPFRQNPGSGLADKHIRFITPLEGGLEKTITGIFAQICSFRGVDQAGIYIFNQRKRQLNLACHYNLPDEILAGAIKFHHDSWLVHAVLEGHSVFNYLQRIPLHSKIAYEQRGIHGVALLPLIHGGQVVGCLDIASQKDEFLSGFEKLVIEGIAERISRTVALHLAQVKLRESNEELTNHMLKLKAKFLQMILPQEPEPLTGCFISMKDEIDRISGVISVATDKVMLKLFDGQKKRELPFLQKMVDAMLSDIDLIIQLTGRLCAFCNSLSAMIERGNLQNDPNGTAGFLDSMTDFYNTLEMPVRNGIKQETAHGAFIPGHFTRMNRPVKLTDLQIRTDRLMPN